MSTKIQVIVSLVLVGLFLSWVFLVLNEEPKPREILNYAVCYSGGEVIFEGYDSLERIEGTWLLFDPVNQGVVVISADCISRRLEKSVLIFNGEVLD